MTKLNLNTPKAPQHGSGRDRGRRSSLPSDRKVGDRPSLVSVVVEQLTGSILAGMFGGSGTLPSESQLANSLGVSRRVVREAMQMLRAQGLVESSQGKVPRV